MWRTGSVVLGLLALVIAPTAHADWLYYGQDVHNSGRVENVIEAPLAIHWQFASRPYVGLAQGEPETVNEGSPIVAGNRIYFASRDRVYCADRESGAMIWRYPAGDQPASTIRSTPLLGDGILYVGANDGYLYAIDANTGSQVWSFRTTGSIRSHPILVRNNPNEAGLVIFGSDDDTLYALDARSAEVVWKYSDTRDDVASTVLYSQQDGLVYVMCSDLSIHAVKVADGKRKWTSRTTVSPLHVSPVIYDQRLYVPAGTSIYSFRLRSGGRDVTSFARSDPEVSADINTTLLVTSDPENLGVSSAELYFFGDRDANFYCATSKGAVRWKTELDGRVRAMPVLTGDVRDAKATIYLGTEKGYVYALRARDGKILWSFHTLAPRDYRVQFAFHDISAPMVVDNGELLVLGDDGTLTCYSADAVDANPPVVSAPSPPRGSVINGTPPLRFSAYAWDEGSGINPDTLAVFLDDQKMPMSEATYRTRGIRPGVVYDPTQRRIEYTTTPGEEGERVTPLSEGRHTIRVQAADWKGNLETLEWSFVVDNTLPVPRRTTPTTTQPGGRPVGAGFGVPGAPGALGGTQNRTRGRLPASRR